MRDISLKEGRGRKVRGAEECLGCTARRRDVTDLSSEYQMLATCSMYH